MRVENTSLNTNSDVDNKILELLLRHDDVIEQLLGDYKDMRLDLEKLKLNCEDGK